ncbi:DUF4382 domain-containing protein [Ideonella sp. BN130291]|uniref:DUF4382 domain-containing protein n=1 Tax=Ideonella sp. BN130291 TaxID=3112940 RepID=UPI002E2659A0|nr:DUF4382 domain-containing protein [Ideonella sp. BN130291]
MSPRIISTMKAWSLAALLALAACGGGGGGSSDTAPPPDAAQGSVSLSFSGGAPSGVDHVWVTVTAVALHASADQPWSASDSSWQVVRLDTPVTVDLAALTNGLVASFLIGQVLPAGDYGQMRLFIAAPDGQLTEGARQLNLLYNAQVDATDSAGAVLHQPLELAQLGLGLRVAGPLHVEAQSNNEITLQLDLQHNLVRLAGDDGNDRFLLRPDLRPLRLDATAAIVGLMDKSAFCAPGVRAAGCVHDVVASALLPSPDGRFKRVERSAPVTVGQDYAVFALYPLPENAMVDVVIRGRNMQTMVVRAVPAAPADLLHATPTQLGGNPADPKHPVPMVPVVRAEGDAFAAVSPPLSQPGVQIVFAQTLPGAGELPLEISSANLDPFTGLLVHAEPLPSGPLRVATYSSAAPLSFADVAPAEGSNRFSVASLGTAYQDTSAWKVVDLPAGASTAITPPDPMARAGLQSGILHVTLGASPAGVFDAAQLVIADVGGVVAVRDVSALLAGGGSLDVDVPAGSNAAALGGTAVYTVSVRAWKRSAAGTSLRWARAAAPVDMRSALTGSASLSAQP